jgi:hypothetical protein
MFDTTKRERWAHTSLHRVLALPMTASTPARAASFTTVRVLATGSGGRWKRFLLHVSHTEPLFQR